LGKLIQISLLLFFSSYALAQLNFDNSVFPSKGDTITYQKDVVSHRLNMTAGANKSWDLSYLESPLFEDWIFQGSDFANDVSQEGFVFNKSGEKISNLYINGEKGLEEVGFVLDNEGLRGGPKAIFYNESLIISSTSLNYGQELEKETSFSFVLNRNELSEDLKKDIPPNISDIRFQGIKTIERHADAYGKMVFPKTTVKVNRVKVIETVELRLYDTDSGKAIPYFPLLKHRQLQFFLPLVFGSLLHEVRQHGFLGSCSLHS